MYARAGIPEYWVVNLVDRQVEVYTRPTGPGAVTPAYASRQDYPAGAAVPLTLDKALAMQAQIKEAKARV